MNDYGVPLQFFPENEHLTTAEREDGWITSKLSDGTRVRKKVLFCYCRPRSTTIHNVGDNVLLSYVSQGWPIFMDQKLVPDDRDSKLTWEVITDNSVHSYNIEKV